MREIKMVAKPWEPQDLIDDLQGIIDEECDNYLNTRRTTLCMARDYLKEHFAEPKWIPVTERLPEYEEPVMGWDAELRDMGIVNFVYGQFLDIIDMSEVNVTHWMPLPEPPKEVE